MQNPVLASHELLCLYLKSFYGLKPCSQPSQGAGPGTRTRSTPIQARSGRHRRRRIAL
jgi:hypothetical protein